MNNIIELEQAMAAEQTMYIDMRSPGEYEEGHIPGAISMPLFSNLERAEVGTTYKQIGAEEAKQQGLEIVSPKLPGIVNQIRDMKQAGKTIVIYCWRGGMRSRSIVSVLAMMGITTYQLKGGYKAYRRYILDSLDSFKLQPKIVVLCGSTGVGKTSLLAYLAAKGIATLDLEKLANHRGSAFGHVGLGRPATAQQFDMAILAQLRALNDEPYIVVECESKRIGNVYLPAVLYQAMQRGSRILLTADLDVRIIRLIEEYTGVYQDNKQAIEASIEALRPRLGQKKTEGLLADLQAGEMRTVVRVLLSGYYDALYGYEAADENKFAAVISANDFDKATADIIEFLHRVRR